VKRGRWRSILFGVGCFLIVLGIFPLAYLLWFGHAHNFKPLSMQLPFKQGEYTSAEFKTDLNESYVVQVELMDSTHRAIGLNPDAVLDLDWKIVDTGGAVLGQGSQNEPIRGANNVNLGEYKPKRGQRQRMIVDVHRDIEEPGGSAVTLEVNSTEDAEGIPFATPPFSLWARIVGGLGAVILLILLVTRPRRLAHSPSATP
jgi:hypothetical protein